jgi:hypothetical protein
MRISIASHAMRQDRVPNSTNHRYVIDPANG